MQQSPPKAGRPSRWSATLPMPRRWPPPSNIGEKHGRIDVLVNNAGITKDGLILRMDDEDFDRDRHESQERLRRDSGRGPADDAGQERPDHQHQSGRGRGGQCRAGQLRRQQGRV